MHAILTPSAKTAMQSGRAKTGAWILRFSSKTPLGVDPVMGWTSMQDTQREVQLTFDTKEAALAYASTHHLTLDIQTAGPSRAKRRAYADNFKFGKRQG